MASRLLTSVIGRCRTASGLISSRGRGVREILQSTRHVGTTTAAASGSHGVPLARTVLGGTATVAIAFTSWVAYSQPTTCEDGQDAEKREPTLLQKCAAEALGTGIIVGPGCAVICAIKYCNAPIGLFGIAAGFGVAVTLAVYATRDVSGAHLNPAVTCALAVNNPNACPSSLVLPYVAAQFFGATVASAVNYAFYGQAIRAFESAQSIVRSSPHTPRATQFVIFKQHNCQRGNLRRWRHRSGFQRIRVTV
eukprot:m.1057037 g.1057037  ORF g.1057037 m.1057037 type:complete len:251 (-) comp24204_c2_seq2:183-935(-)